MHDRILDSISLTAAHERQTTTAESTNDIEYFLACILREFMHVKRKPYNEKSHLMLKRDQRDPIRNPDHGPSLTLARPAQTW